MSQTTSFRKIILALSALFIFTAIGTTLVIAQSSDHPPSGVIELPAIPVPLDDPDDALKVGVARTDISPEQPAILGGYGACFWSKKRCRWSEGIHDPLYSTALYFEINDDSLMLMSLDLLGLIAGDINDIRLAIAGSIPVPEHRIIVSTTHTHHSPDTVGLWGTIFPPSSGRDEAYLDLVKKRAVESAVKAYKAKTPAKLQYAVGQIEELHFNTYEEKIKGVSIDHTLTVLTADKLDGTPIAVLANWGCHTTAEKGGNRLVSSDWAGAYYQWMAGRYQGVPMFINGSIGAAIQPSVPWRDANLHAEAQGFIWAEALGRNFAEVTLDLMNNKMVDLPLTEIEIASREITVPMENKIFRLAKKLKVLSMDIPEVGEPITTQVTAVKLGPLRIGTVPGEISPHLGDQVRQALGGKAQLLVGLGQDWLGYIIDEKQYDDKTFAYEKMLCVSPKLADGVIEAHRYLARTAFSGDEAAAPTEQTDLDQAAGF